MAPERPGAASLPLKPVEFCAGHGIGLRPGVRAEKLTRQTKAVHLSTGEVPSWATRLRPEGDRGDRSLTNSRRLKVDDTDTDLNAYERRVRACGRPTQSAQSPH